ncbi:MAG TPA: hypothetical protein VIW24_24745 [Aldersonia sp.]
MPTATRHQAPLMLIDEGTRRAPHTMPSSTERPDGLRLRCFRMLGTASAVGAQL